MKKFYQGTVDYACGLYAVLNALALTHDIGLQNARHMYQRTIEHIAASPAAWKAFMNNHTDHFWVVAYMLSRWCTEPPAKYTMRQPFSSCLLPTGNANTAERRYMPFHSLPDSFDGIPFYLDQEDTIQHHGQSAIKDNQTKQVWDRLERWFADKQEDDRTAIVKFHRFFSQVKQPVVSHWTTIKDLEQNSIILHDASADEGALCAIPKEDTLYKGSTPPPVALVPASLVLLRRP